MKRHEQALMFMRKAAEDETLVDEVLASRRVSDAIIGFHCQQAAEKLLKAVLSEFGAEFRRTHDLREPLDLLADAGHAVPQTLARLDFLTPYATLLRYEGIPAKVPLNRRRARSAIRRCRAWAEKQIGLSPGLFV
jgi:HEPN domain-containing protein